MKKRYVFGILIVILGLLFFFTPFQIAHVCGLKPDGSFMKCHWMGEVVRMLGGLITVMGLLFVFFLFLRKLVVYLSSKNKTKNI